MRRPQFTIRSLLVAMLLVGVGCVAVPPLIKRYAEYSVRKQVDGYWREHLDVFPNLKRSYR